ncbi:hypothetical protein [Streptomyces sp. BBFR102]|uniref:hypothetical protein n=1 Tax=Streptomyces sp. BBFR102 TaxID=3448171 RepID=UPI003F52F1C7
MRAQLAARSTRLVLALSATVALTAGLTACDPDDRAAEGQSPAQSSGGAEAPGDSSPGDAKPSKDSGGSSKDEPAREPGDTCRTGDLEYSVTAKDGGVLIIKAKAQNHLMCQLDHTAPLVIFNSSERTKPYPAELMKLTPPDSIELSGTKAAYAALIPNTNRAEDVVDVDAAHIVIGEDESDPAFVKLPDTYTVSESAVTDWYPSPDAATPEAN